MARHVESVAMESTGVYWIAPHEVLEGQGLQVLLVDTRQRDGFKDSERQGLNRGSALRSYPG
jgi:transposase